MKKDIDLRSLTREDLQAFHASFSASATELADLEGALEGRKMIGGTARSSVESAVAVARDDTKSRLSALEAEVKR